MAESNKEREKVIKQETGGNLPEVTNEILRLIRKYEGGRIPQLVDDENPERGLVNGDLLRIYHKGFVVMNVIPLGILYVQGDCKDPVLKWEKGCSGYLQNALPRGECTLVCKAIKADGKGIESCERCDRKWAKRAEKEKNVICYMCDHGMIDFATPIYVKGNVVAVIMSGQRAPKSGTLWNQEFTEGGLFDRKGCNNLGANALAVTHEIFQKTETYYGFSKDTLRFNLEEDIKSDPRIEVTPDNVEDIRQTMEKASKQISMLAETTYELEKSKAVAAIRSAIARSVAQRGVNIGNVSETVMSVTSNLSTATKLICKYFGIDYVVVVNLHNELPQYRVLLECGPDKMSLLVGVWSEEVEETVYKKIMNAIKKIPRFGNVDLKIFRDLPFFKEVAGWSKGKHTWQCIGARLDHSGLPVCALISGRERGLRLADFREKDAEDFRLVVEDIGMVMNVLLYIDRLHDAGEAQALFAEDVAHDIRNPVQNLLFMIERLKLGITQDQVNEIGAQVRRISKLSERVWLLELIRKEGLELDKAGYVGVYEVVMEAIAMVKSMAEEKGVKIEVDPDLKKWRAIQVDRKFFLQAMLNLVDNAVKYSHEGMKVRIDGKIDWPKCKISVINRGVELKDNYKDSIYKRGFRTPEAKMHIKDGCGIGLCIVKSFADIYGDISSKCTPVYGTYDFVTEFQLSIEGDI